MSQGVEGREKRGGRCRCGGDGRGGWVEEGPDTGWSGKRLSRIFVAQKPFIKKLIWDYFLLHAITL